jgi:hypothetical protein
MKKLIAILAATIGLGGLSAFAQDWITVANSGNYVVWDQFSTPGTAKVAGLNDVNIEVLWAVSGTTDLLGGGSATNGASATSPSAAQTDISTMLSSGWTLAQNSASGAGTAALGTVETTSGGVTGGKGGSVVAYNGGNPFEVDTSSTGASGSTIELLYIAFNGGASSYLTASDLGWTSMLSEPIGTTSGDPNATTPQTFGPSTGTSFGVSPVPEPTTLALAGLGGLSMLGLRRRKA